MLEDFERTKICDVVKFGCGREAAAKYVGLTLEQLEAEIVRDEELAKELLRAEGAALPASELADAGTEAANQEAFHDLFVGVAMQASPSGVANPIRIATSGVFEFECLPVTAEVGDLIGVDEEGTGTELTTQVVAKVATANLAIGRCAKRANPAATRLLVEIVSTVLRGGPQVMA